MNWRKIHFYLHAFCRYFLATIIISYAFAKILGTQFTSQPSTYDKPVGLLSGFELTWYYYGYSFWYGLCIAAAQIVSSLLLFFRKTTRIGIVLYLSFMVNILMVDFAYDVNGAQGMATVLTIMALFVFFSEFPLFFKYFYEEPPLFQDQERPKWFNKTSKIKWVYIPIVFAGFFMILSGLKNKYMGLTQFYGTWQNTNPAAPFKRLYFEANNTFKVSEKSDNKIIANGEYSYTKDRILMLGYTNKYKMSPIRMIANSAPDTVKKRLQLSGKYLITATQLSIETDTGKMVFNKVVRR